MDSGNCQTFTATPAEPGELPWELGQHLYWAFRSQVATRHSRRGHDSRICICRAEVAPLKIKCDVHQTDHDRHLNQRADDGRKRSA